jgi:hypothetical protein
MMPRREYTAAQALGRRVLENETELREQLNTDSRALNVIQRYKIANSNKRGCKGCGNKRLLGWLADEIRRLEEPENETVRTIVDRSA